MRRMITAATVGMMLCLAACGKSPESMTYKEFRELPKEEQQRFGKEMKMEDVAALMRGTLRYRGDSARLNDMTLGEIMQAGRDTTR